jgi:DNA-binding winged helix-turn-helix (wHTH) protein
VIGSRALDALGVLIEGDGDLVSKDEIRAAVWPGTVVEDNNLTVQISALRRILDHGLPEGSCIQTVAGLRSPKPPLMCGRGGAGPRRCGSRRRAV